MELYSRRWLGWSISQRNDAELVVASLQNAIRNAAQRPMRTILHSDQGSTYASERVQKLLRDHRLKPSMSRRGNRWDNAPMESFFASLKTELGDTFTSVRDADRELFRYIDGYYNRHRRHSAIKYQIPSHFELASLQSHLYKKKQLQRIAADVLT